VNTLEALNPRFDSNWLSRVEDAGLNASAAPQQLWIDGWIVRFCRGKAKRARCINAVAAGRWPVAQRLAECARIYAEAGLPMIVRITPFTLPPDLDQLLAASGHSRFDETQVMAKPDLGATPVTLGSGITVKPIGLEAFAHRVGGFRGSPLSHRQAHAQRLLNSPVPFAAFELQLRGDPLACGQLAMEGELAGLYDIYTATSGRGKGLATQLCQHLLHHAHQRGAKSAYLQVDASNEPARALYRRLGFADAYGYHYRALDPQSA